jgi:hypothetical protein
MVKDTGQAKIKLACAIALLILLPGCAERRAVRASVTTSIPDISTYPVAGPTPDWASPQPANTQPAASIEEAANGLSFSPVVPFFGDPEAVFVSREETPQDERVLFLVYGLAEGAPFWVVEAAAGPTWRDNLDEQVENCIPPDCTGLSVVIIRESQRALLDASPQVTALLWKEGDVEVRLQGPADTFTPDVALEKANSL